MSIIFLIHKNQSYPNYILLYYLSHLHLCLFAAFLSLHYLLSPCIRKKISEHSKDNQYQDVAAFYSAR